MDLNSLTGADLDKYGKTQGVFRYQGLGLPEDDDSYRESIRHNVKGAISSFQRASEHDVCVSIEKRVYHSGIDPMYAVLVIDSQGTVIRVASEYNNNAMAVYNSLQLADKAATEWKKRTHNASNRYDYVVREIKLFEG